MIDKQRKKQLNVTEKQGEQLKNTKNNKINQYKYWKGRKIRKNCVVKRQPK